MATRRAQARTRDIGRTSRGAQPQVTRAIVTGASGLVGSAALGQALASPRVERATVVGRRSTGRAHPKLREVAVTDLAGADRDLLAEHDVAQ